MNINNGNRRFKTVDIVIAFCLILAGLSVLSVLASSVMNMLGLHYTSLKSFILYFIIASVVSYILNIVLGALYGTFLATTGIGNKLNGKMWRFSLILLDILSSVIGFMVVDFLMLSVSASFISILIISVIFAVLSIRKDK